MFYKNQKQDFVFFVYDFDTGLGVEGESVGVNISLDGDSFYYKEKASEISYGYYAIKLDNVDTNADIIALYYDNLSRSNYLIEGPHVFFTREKITSAVTVATGGITSDSFATGAITDAAIANYAISSGKIADGAITSAKINTNAISASKIADNAITSSKIASGAITSTGIADNAITSSKIASGAISDVKLNSDVTVIASSVLDKSGYSLSSTGLDSIPITAPTGVATTFREMVVQVWRRFFKKVVKNSSQIQTFDDDDSSVLTSQNITDTITTQSQGSAS